MSCKDDMGEGSFHMNAENQNDAELARRIRCGAQPQAKARGKFLLEDAIAREPGVGP